MVCASGSCHLDYCDFGLEDFGCCVGEVWFWCDGGHGLQWSDCSGNNPPMNTCGWDNSGYQCGGDGADPDGVLPLECCLPDCDKKDCGSDGCWGNCGQCEDEHADCVDGKCECTALCGGSECGDDGCGGSCGECGSGCCVDGACQDITYTDPDSLLMWEVPTLDNNGNQAALAEGCSGLEMCGYDDWRLPNVAEMRTLIRGCPATMPGGTCNVEAGVCLESSCAHPSCEGCAEYDGPGELGRYWPKEMGQYGVAFFSADDVLDGGEQVWTLHVKFGKIFAYGDDSFIQYRMCVR